MDLKQFKSLTKPIEKKAQIHTKRQKKADKLFELGMSCLEQAHFEDFSNQQTLLDAMEHLVGSIQHNRRDVRPFLAVAYLYSLINYFDKAIEFLNGALEIDSDNPIILSMKQAFTELEEEAKTETAALPSISDAGQSEVDYDELYDKLEKFIISEFKLTMAHSLPSPTYKAEIIEDIEGEIKTKEELCQNIQAQIDILDQEIDISELNNKFKPLRMTLNRLINLRNNCEQFQDAMEQIILATTEIRESNERIDLLDPEDNIDQELLDPLIDRCDLIADKLDGMAELNLKITSLVKHYDLLIMGLEQIQSKIDDAVELSV